MKIKKSNVSYCQFSEYLLFDVEISMHWENVTARLLIAVRSWLYEED